MHTGTNLFSPRSNREMGKERERLRESKRLVRLLFKFMETVETYEKRNFA